jgi:hypothetical protein
MLGLNGFSLGKVPHITNNPSFCVNPKAETFMLKNQRESSAEHEGIREVRGRSGVDDLLDVGLDEAPWCEHASGDGFEDHFSGFGA